jgi:inner membrane protein
MNLIEPPPLLTTTSPAARRRSLLFKLAGIGALILLLHIPLFMTRGVLLERQGYQREAAREISSTWGQSQVVRGVVLAVPYGYRANVVRSKVVAGKVAQVEETELVRATAYFLPDGLEVTGAVTPEVRRRGIYESVVYSAKLDLAGNFLPDFSAAGIAADQIDWDKAEILFGVKDLRGLRSVSPVTVNAGKSYGVETADGADNDGFALAAKIEGVADKQKLTFALSAVVQGSERLDVLPVGKATRVVLTSPWTEPSFGGASLPVSRTVGAEGFKAEWESAHFSRGFGQSWTNRLTPNHEILGKIHAAGFGVAFTQPIDGYRLAERAQKYGVLFFVLVFSVFFLFEMTSNLRIHPLQYAMVGAALCLFFLGFLALSEIWPSGLAYAVAASSCTLMIALYAWSFLRTGWRTLIIAAGLAATYGYLYFVLQSQDYALIAGTAALFVALAIVMYFTRKIDWFTQETAKPVAA